MKNLNIKFQEEYKSVDKLIKDAYGTSEGVSEYIRQLEDEIHNSRTCKDDFYKLKHVRWIRNQLAHEVSIDSDICEKEDYDWLCNFHDRLLSGNDSLAVTNRKNHRNKGTYGSNLDSPNDNNILLMIAVVIIIVALIVWTIKFII